MSTPTTTYDELPYDCGPLSATHPDNLAAVATIHGMTAPEPERCRVLELGCGIGYNLLAMAVSLPHARFTGIDLSSRQITEGMKTVATLALKNVELKAMSLLDVDESFGQFDYIIAHGIYSWVPPAVQDKILEVCKRNLAPNGIAYVSYNTYPGWHQRGMVREMMNFHTREFAEPRQRVAQARALLAFLIEGYPKVGNQNYRQILVDEQNLLEKAADTYLFHEHLEEVNQPQYFHEFMNRAGAKGLQYIDEARPHSPIALFPATTRETLNQIAANLIDREQYLDFLHNRCFRRTLLCHSGPALSREPADGLATRFRFSSFAQCSDANPDLTGTTAVAFRGEVFQGVTDQPVVKIAIAELIRQCPARFTFDELFDRVWLQIQGKPNTPATREEARTLLGGALLSSYQTTLVRLHVTPAPFTTNVSARPVASVLARYEAATDESTVSTLCHSTITLEPPARRLLSQLDGTNDIATLAAKMADTVPAEDLKAGWIPAQLRELARMALLTG